MLNLSKLAREDPGYPLTKKLISLIDPDIYLAENIADYKKEAPSLNFEWYKRFPVSNKTMDRVYIVFHNVGLRKAIHKEQEYPNWFILHDDSAEEIVYWDANHNLFPTLASFEEMQEKQGLNDGDWVCDVFVRYLINHNFSSIIEINKYNRSKREPEKDSISDRIKKFFPDFNPAWQPA